jgi:hypothetical protein
MSSHAQNKRSAIRPYFPPFIINAFFIVIILGFTAAITVVFVLASNSFNQALDQFEKIEEMLLQAAAAYNGTLDIALIVQYLPILDPFLDHISTFTNLFTIGYKLWITAAVSVIAIVCVRS